MTNRLNHWMVTITLGASLLAGEVWAETRNGNNSLPENKEWFIGGGLGIQGYVGESDGMANFGDRISAGGEVFFGKWITPAFGLRLQINGAHVIGANSNGSKESWNYVHYHMDGLLDLTMLIKGRKDKQVYHAIPLVGIGGITVAGKENRTTPSLTVGLLNQFRIHPQVDLNLEAKASLVGDRLNGVATGRKGEGTAMLTAGLTYRF